MVKNDGIQMFLWNGSIKQSECFKQQKGIEVNEKLAMKCERLLVMVRRAQNRHACYLSHGKGALPKTQKTEPTFGGETQILSPNKSCVTSSLFTR